MSTVPTIKLDEMRTDGPGSMDVELQLKDGDLIMQAQREAKHRKVPFLPTTGRGGVGTIRNPWPKMTGKQIKAARKAAREAAKKNKPEVVTEDEPCSV